MSELIEKSYAGEVEEENESFSFTKDIDGIRKTVSGEKVENGWIVTIEKSWYEKDLASGNKEWKHNTFRYITKNNPLDKIRKKQTEEVGDEADIGNLLRDVANDSGMLLVD